MKIDTLRAVFSYGLAGAIVIGGFLFLYFTSDSTSPRIDTNTLAIVGFMGAAVNFIFGQEQATRAVKSFQNGLNTPTPEDIK